MSRRVDRASVPHTRPRQRDPMSCRNISGMTVSGSLKDKAPLPPWSNVVSRSILSISAMLAPILAFLVIIVTLGWCKP